MGVKGISPDFVKKAEKYEGNIKNIMYILGRNL